MLSGAAESTGFQLAALAAAAAGLAGIVTYYGRRARRAEVMVGEGGVALPNAAVPPSKRTRLAAPLSEDANPNLDDSESVYLEYPHDEDPDPFPLLALADHTVFLDVCKFLPAKSIARLKAACRSLCDGLNTEEAVQWVVASRDWHTLRRIHRVGDLPLELPDGEWCLERLHLAENPPRFRPLKFGFGSNHLVRDGLNSTIVCLEEIAQLMYNHKGMRMRVTGYTQPDAPRYIARRISAARAAVAVLYLAARLLGLGVSSHNINALRAVLICTPMEEGGHASQGQQLRDSGFVQPLPQMLHYETSDDEVVVLSEPEDTEVDDVSSTDTDHETDSGSSSDGGSGDVESEDDAGGEEEEDGADRPQPIGNSVRTQQVEAPPGWSLEGARLKGGRLPALASTQPRLASREALREALLDVLERFEQVAAGGSTPINTNWVSLAIICSIGDLCGRPCACLDKPCTLTGINFLL
mmetsp:Transcript_15399/g.39674  ORF Transcript_15399/g.39674 Transcript_15399/m.39674 type:complete len:468 (-) Transcript_15399:1002-2405(-)